MTRIINWILEEVNDHDQMQVLKSPLPDGENMTLCEFLQDGRAFCLLINIFTNELNEERSKFGSKIPANGLSKRLERSLNSDSKFHSLERVQFFIKWCRTECGLEEHQVFTTVQLLEDANEEAVEACMIAFQKRFRTPKPPTPPPMSKLTEFMSNCSWAPPALPSPPPEVEDERELISKEAKALQRQQSGIAASWVSAVESSTPEKERDENGEKNPVKLKIPSAFNQVKAAVTIQKSTASPRKWKPWSKKKSSVDENDSSADASKVPMLEEQVALRGSIIERVDSVGEVDSDEREVQEDQEEQVQEVKEEKEEESAVDNSPPVERVSSGSRSSFTSPPKSSSGVSKLSAFLSQVKSGGPPKIHKIESARRLVPMDDEDEVESEPDNTFNQSKEMEQVKEEHEDDISDNEIDDRKESVENENRENGSYSTNSVQSSTSKLSAFLTEVPSDTPHLPEEQEANRNSQESIEEPNQTVHNKELQSDPAEEFDEEEYSFQERSNSLKLTESEILVEENLLLKEKLSKVEEKTKILEEQFAKLQSEFQLVMQQLKLQN